MNQNTVITFSNRLQLYSTALYSCTDYSCTDYSCMYTSNTGSGVILLIKSDHLGDRCHRWFVMLLFVCKYIGVYIIS